MPDGGVKLWSFHCSAERLPSGDYRVCIVSDSGVRRESVGYHALWELIRLIGKDDHEARAAEIAAALKEVGHA